MTSLLILIFLKFCKHKEYKKNIKYNSGFDKIRINKEIFSIIVTLGYN